MAIPNPTGPKPTVSHQYQATPCPARTDPTLELHPQPLRHPFRPGNIPCPLDNRTRRRGGIIPAKESQEFYPGHKPEPPTPSGLQQTSVLPSMERFDLCPFPGPGAGHQTRNIGETVLGLRIDLGNVHCCPFLPIDVHRRLREDTLVVTTSQHQKPLFSDIILLVSVGSRNFLSGDGR